MASMELAWKAAQKDSQTASSVLMEGVLVGAHSGNMSGRRTFRLTRNELTYREPPGVASVTRKVILVRDLSSVYLDGRSVVVTLRKSAQHGNPTKAITLEAEDEASAAKWQAAFIAASVPAAASNSQWGVISRRQISSQFADYLPFMLKGRQIPLHSSSNSPPEHCPEPLLEHARREALAVLDVLCADCVNTPALLSAVCAQAMAEHAVTPAGQAIALVVLRHFFSGSREDEATPPLEETWLRALVYSELGLLQQRRGGVVETAKVSHTMVLRQEGITSVAISSVLRIAFQCGALNYNVLSPVFSDTPPSTEDGDTTVAHCCSSCLGRLSDFLVGPSAERELAIEKKAVAIIRAFARSCREASSTRASVAVSVRSEAVGEKTANEMRGHRVEHDEQSEEEEEAEGIDATCKSSADDFFFALLGGGLFLRVLCPALLMPDRWGVLAPPHLPSKGQGAEGELFLAQKAVEDGFSAAAAVLAHLLLASKEAPGNSSTAGVANAGCQEGSLLAPAGWEALRSLSSIAPLEVATQALSGFMSGHLNQPRYCTPVASGADMKAHAKATARFLQRIANAVPVCCPDPLAAVVSSPRSPQVLALPLRHMYRRLSEV